MRRKLKATDGIPHSARPRSVCTPSLHAAPSAVRMANHGKRPRWGEVRASSSNASSAPAGPSRLRVCAACGIAVPLFNGCAGLRLERGLATNRTKQVVQPPTKSAGLSTWPSSVSAACRIAAPQIHQKPDRLSRYPCAAPAGASHSVRTRLGRRHRLPIGRLSRRILADMSSRHAPGKGESRKRS